MKPSRNLFLRSASIAAIALMGAASSTFAATFYWDGTTGDWNDITMWSTDLAGTTDPTTLPLATVSDILNFNTTPGAASTSTLYLNGTRGSSAPILATMNFSASGATTLLGGVSGTPANNDLFSGAITVSSTAGAVTIGDIALSPSAKVNLKVGSVSFTNNSTSLLTLANGLNSFGTGGATTYTFTGSGNTTAGGVIGNGTGTNKVALIKSGNGTLTLSGVNTYSSTTTISGGNLTVSSSGVINNGNVAAGTASISSAATLRVDGGTAKFNTSAGTDAGLLVGTTTAGNVVVTNNGTLTITTGRMILGGSAAGSGTSSLTQDSGTTTVASNFYSGNYNASDIAISGGSFTVNGTSNISQRATTNFTISGTASVTFPTLNLGGQPGTYDVNINLNGGTLSVNTVANMVNGTTYFNFDGGTLKARQANADFLNADFVYVKAGGATIDTDIHDVTIDNALLQSGVTVGALTKTGAGKLTLSNANTYAGNTDVRTGTLVLAAAGSQKFYPKADASSNKITDTNPIDTEPVPVQGIVNLDGAFAIDLTAAAAAANGTEWLLVDVPNLAETYSSTFTVTDFTETPADSGIWKKTEAPNTYTFTESTGKLSLAVGTSNTYADWLTANSPATGFTTDSDNDGVSNGVENVLGSNPNVSSAGLTNVSATTSSATCQHTLNPTIASDVSYSYEWSTDLVEWKATTETNTAGTTATITPSAPVSGVVTVTTAITFGPTAKLFTRLNATKP